MAWSFFNFIPNGPHNDARFPVTAEKGFKLVQTEADSNPITFDCNTVEVSRLDPATKTWQRVFRSHNNKNTLVITDARIAVVFPKPPVKRSMISVVALAQAATQHGAHKGETFAGHIPYENLVGVLARRGSVGFPGIAGSIGFLAEDKSSDAGGVRVRVEVYPVGRNDTLPTGNDVFARALRLRGTHPAFASSDLTQDRELAQQPMAHADRKEYAVKQFSQYKPIRA